MRALYAVLSHDISSRICDVALNIIDCLLQLGVVPGMGKKLSKPDKENQEARAKDPAGQGLGGGAQGGGAVPGAGAGGGGDGGGGGGGGGSGGGSGQGSKDDVKNNKDNDKKVGSYVLFGSGLQRLSLRMSKYICIKLCVHVCVLRRKQEEGSGFSTHRLALTMLIKIVKSLGCAYGCGEGHRGLSGDRLRMQVRLSST